MSSVLIRGMEMPTSCCGCEFSVFTPTGTIPFCRRTRKDLAADVYFNKRDSDCPLIPVPEHGDLIDRDAYEYPGDLIYEPVIIPADPAEEGE